MFSTWTTEVPGGTDGAMYVSRTVQRPVASMSARPGASMAA
jgi:hypothetical protein